MIGIIDYGMGNLKSVENAFCKLGFEVFVTAKPNELDRADRIVLSGTGAFEGAIQALRSQGWVKKIKTAIRRGKPFLGISLGMQLLFETSEENGTHEGLGIFPGKVTRIPNLKIPHMGWNRLEIRKESDIFSVRDSNDNYVYFAHSYRAEADPAYVSASTFYGTDLTAAVERDNVYALQFHPEKSGPTGIEILKRFALVQPKSLRRVVSLRKPTYGAALFFGSYYGGYVDSFPRH
ncbi:MAG: imidazole glycerol phosphate synthase subunit HisH [Synergistaceae bacterium]|nr:imidazole glycerol phosphate synthase subunit HisH [Synergistaceae bacterium]